MKKPPPLLFWDVDTQVDFMLPQGALYVPEAEGLLPSLARLSEAARRHGIPVVASADHHSLGDAEISEDPNWQTTFPPHCMAGTPGAEKVPETRLEAPVRLDWEPKDRSELISALEVERPEILLLKNTLDVFSNPNTETVLEILAPRRVVVYGVALDFCHRRAVEGLWSRGFNDLEIVVDATRAIDGRRGERLLESWQELGMKRVSTEQVLERLS
ncbi:MAG: cysteine hydrolase family protein [Acidobacteria bacterium]|nr:cysteine hydrolase family protein [Acidobacteriota bacterium]